MGCVQGPSITVDPSAPCLRTRSSRAHLLTGTVYVLNVWVDLSTLDLSYTASHESVLFTDDKASEAPVKPPHISREEAEELPLPLFHGVWGREGGWGRGVHLTGQLHENSALLPNS